MIRIGIIGSQSMHAWAFARECNLPDETGRYLIPDCRVTAICGVDDTSEHTVETAQKGGIPEIVEQPEQLYDICDAVMVLTRRGETHIKYALPFIERGYPVFIDKPVCISDEDIVTLKTITAEKNCIIAGGSGLKHCNSVKEMKKQIDSGSLGNIIGLSVSHAADMDCEYNGIYFYACHAVEIMLTLLGRDICSVEASVFNHNNFSVLVKYHEKFANLLFTSGRNGNFINIFGDKDSISCPINQSDIFRNTMLDFVNKIRNKNATKNIDEIIEHIYVLRNIDKALKES